MLSLKIHKMKHLSQVNWENTEIPVLAHVVAHYDHCTGILPVGLMMRSYGKPNFIST